MPDVNMEYNPETGRMEGTYRVDCDRCGVKYTGIYDVPHFCKEPPIYVAMPILRFEPFDVGPPKPPPYDRDVAADQACRVLFGSSLT